MRESDYAVGENTAEAVRVLSGSAVLRRREGKLCQLIYSLEESDGKTGVKDCEYSVFNRSFQDLSCMRGKILKSLPNGGQLRRHEDGTVFAHLQRTTATDSLWDRVWNTHEQICVFRDEHGIHLISCRYGYRIGRIDIYINIRPAVRGLLGSSKLPNAERPPDAGQNQNGHGPPMRVRFHTFWSDLQNMWI